MDVTFERTSQFRTIHVDGAWGGVTPNGGIAVSLYHEHNPVPSKVTLRLEKGGTIQEDKSGGRGIRREIEVEARMTPEVARALAEWLSRKADEADEIFAKAAQAAADAAEGEPENAK